MIAHSQLAPMPAELPFKIVSKTIGQGAYACIKKARMPSSQQIFAVKFIHKDYAMRHGRVSAKQLALEITLHKHLGSHPNIIQFFQAGEDMAWRWIAMELAEGGDLFDKIESDQGVDIDIAHVYFTQLVSAVAYMHSKKVGHRDIKPENILLSLDGNLKIADFGLVVLFEHRGQRKISKTSCGSPPYTSPEVLQCNAAPRDSSLGYCGDLVDIWSCGVVLFVLLAGNTPWDEPADNSYEYWQYKNSTGKPPEDELWANLDDDVVNLLRGMMAVDPNTRASIEDIQKHPWFCRPNPHLTSNGRLANPLALATQMFESMHIDFSQDPLAPSQSSQRIVVPSSADAMDLDPASQREVISSTPTNPETPTAEIQFDWETTVLPSQSQRLNGHWVKPATQASQSLDDHLADEPSCSQFAPQPAVPLSRTQFARRFADILPSHSMTRFFSEWDLPRLLAYIVVALRRLDVPVSDDISEGAAGEATFIKLRTKDERKCRMSGEVVFEKMRAEGGHTVGVQVCFVKTTGDPVQWRRLFKKVVQLCQDSVWKPE